MQRRTKTSIKYIIVLLAVAVFISLSTYQSTAHAEDYTAHDGDGWSVTEDGVMTIESNRGWWNAMKNGYIVRVNKLVIGKDLTEFRIYSLPYDIPSPDFFDKSDIAGYDKYGNPYYDYIRVTDIHPYQIEVEAGNPVFQVVDGLLINNATGELVLSETRVTEVVIPEGVKAVTRDAFSERDLISVQFPQTLESIGESTFAKCENLTSIVLPDSLTELSHGAFLGCKKLHEVTLSQNLRELASSTFGYTALQHIEIPAGVTEIGSNTFMGCEQLEEVDFPDGLRSINDGAFSSCSKLYNVVLPDGLEYIGSNAFYSCEGLKNVVIPNSVELVGNSPFSGCQLALLRIPAQLDIVVYDFDGYIFTENKRTRKNRGLELSSVDTVILSGSDYDFGYPAITNAKNV